LHFTPTSSSWLNLVERWFAELTSKKLHRGAHRSVRDLNADIRAWIKTWTYDPKPYVWTKIADQILESIAAYCTRINESRQAPDAAHDAPVRADLEIRQGISGQADRVSRAHVVVRDGSRLEIL